MVRVYRCRECDGCEYRAQCTPSKRGRGIEVPEHDKLLQKQRELQKDPETRALLNMRNQIVETRFGEIKHDQGFRGWTMKGLSGVRAQWAPVCAANNLRTLFRIWRAGDLVLGAR